MLGFAFQKGLIPLQEESILKAIELNAVAVDSNKQAFDWGRHAAVNLEQVEKIALPPKPVVVQMPQNLETLLRRRAGFLTEYQNATYAKRYEDLVGKVRDAEARLGTGDSLSKAVAKNLFKLMAYKDEYEVARLFTEGSFEKRLNEAFEGDFTVSYNLAPPLFTKRDAQGHLIKKKYGRWMKSAFGLLARLKGLRGTALDVFGYTAERKMERELVRDYEALVSEMVATLSSKNHRTAVELASLPERIRGFGHVKDANVAAVAIEREKLVQRFRHGADVGLAA
jgi:indolepyruvate ferredoxin oxidoreductase